MSGKGFLLGFIAILLKITLSFSQEQQKVFYEIVKGDSALLYFNKDFSFTGKECHDFVRHVRISEKGDFNGYFEDRSTEGILLGKGTYKNGVKNGYFELYYHTGILYCAGVYQNNKPIGTWQYFYESSIPERTITFIDSTALLVQHLDFMGLAKVQNGTGKFDGIIDAEIPTYVIGEVVDGKADGKWFIPGLNGTSLYTERFEKGKLIKSSLVSKRKMNANPVPPKLNKFFLGNYLFLLEKFKYQSCDEAQQYHINTNSVDARLFNNYVRQRINNLIHTNIRFKQDDYYKLGDNFMTIQFSVDEKGKPYDIKMASEWGGYFFESVKSSLNKAVFSTRYKTLYFHLKFSYANGLRYKYSFKFSRRDRKSKQ